MCQSVNMSAGRQKPESGPVWGSTGNRIKSVFTNPIICINYLLHSLCCLQDLTSSIVGNIHSRSVGVEVALNQGGEELCSADPSHEGSVTIVIAAVEATAAAIAALHRASLEQ